MAMPSLFVLERPQRVVIAPTAVAATCFCCVLLLCSFTCALAGISCFVCESVNGSNPNCGDPFNSSAMPLTSDCGQGLPGRGGQYPARFCYKLKGRRKSDSVELLIRHCSVDTLVDNSLKSHCGSYAQFKVKNSGAEDYYDGCISMCRFDGCNGAAASARGGRQLLWLAVLLTLATIILRVF